MKAWMVLVACFAVACSDDGESGEGNGGTSGAGGASGQTGSGGTSGGKGGGGSGGTSGGSGGSGGNGGSLTGKPSGDGCVAADECYPAGQNEPECRTEWPDGYCTGACITSVDCPGDEGTCQEYMGETLCLHVCNEPDDCREGYACDLGVNGCVPEN